MKRGAGRSDAGQAAGRTNGDEQADKVRVITAALPPDRSHVKLTMLPGSGASGEILLTTRGLEVLIQTLGRVIAMMREGQPTPALDTTRIPFVFDPHWHVTRELMGEAAALALYHPSYGPLGFLLPIGKVETMIAALSQQVRAAMAEREARQN